MLIELLLALLIGIIFGTITGLIPGIHTNLVGVFLVSISSTLLIGVNPLYLIVFITSMAMTHTFIDFIPCIFLGCPDTDTELAVLPGHDLLKKGQGYEAILLSVYGSIFAIAILILVTWPSTIIFPKINELTKNIMPYILIGVSSILLLMERNKKTAFLIFFLTGALGYLTLNLEGLKQPLLPLLTGLFGSSMLLESINSKTKIPEQNPQDVKFKKRKFIRPMFASLLASPICSFLPGLGSGQAAIIGQSIAGSNKDRKGFIVLIGATNTLVMGFSFITLYLISKTRTGATVAISEIMNQITPEILTIILISIALTGIISFYLTKFLAKFFSKKINKINYTKLSLITLILLGIVTVLVSGFLGLLMLIIATATGIYCIKTGVRKTLMMGCLMIPTILLYFGL